MILLKANTEITTVFQKMINTMGEKVKWTEIFLINNNDIILAGEGKSLFFNFDNRRIFSKFVELTINEDRVEQITGNPLLENTLNMILYAFGKWGEIKGLKVETNYEQLNRLLNNILAEIDIGASLTSDNFRFYKDGVQITYEEVIQLILDKFKSDDEDNEEESEEEDDEDNANESKEDESKEGQSIEDEYALGLWHNIRWTTGRFSFEKVELTSTEREKLRPGNSFYVVNYKCPDCGEKLYMVVYPTGKEFRIETDEEPVYMSRVYTCSGCNHFYTPKPHKLLIEGDVYHLTFDDDKVAYEDYLELLGRLGERTANSNFNLYESEYNKKNEEEPEELDDIYNNVETMSEEKISEIKDRMDSGFYPLKSVEKYYGKLAKELKDRKNNKNRDIINEGTSGDIEYLGSKNKGAKNKSIDNKSSNGNGTTNKATKDKSATKKLKHNERNSDSSEDYKNRKRKENGTPSITLAKTSENKYITPSIKQEVKLHLNKPNAEKSESKAAKPRDIQKSKSQYFNKGSIKQGEAKLNHSVDDFVSMTLDGLKEILAGILKGDHNSFDSKVDKLTSKQLGNLKSLFQSEKRLNKNEKQNYIDKIEIAWSRENIRELNQKIELSKDKNYVEILRMIDEIKKEDYSENVKKPFLESLMEYLQRSGETELKNLILHIPESINKKQHIQFADKIEQYKEINTDRYKKILDEKRGASEKQEITTFIKQANATNRKSLFDLYNKLKEQDFSERNVTSYLEDIHDKIYAIDEAAIKRICPDPADITFEDGLKMYDEISSGDFLPELKVNTLGLIDKRLKKLKMDECEQLVNKFSKDMKWTSEDFPRIYFYDVRKMMRGNGNDVQSVIIHNALNTYAVNRGKYEYPILICDTSYSRNGKAGFVLTPDHIFYRSMVSSAVMNVVDVEEVYGRTRLFGKGIYVKHKYEGKQRILKSVRSMKLKSLGGTLNLFLDYLKEKPESRSLSYLAKEKHPVICCYRCGYVYKGGNVCPKCGSKIND